MKNKIFIVALLSLPYLVLGQVAPQGGVYIRIQGTDTYVLMPAGSILSGVQTTTDKKDGLPVYEFIPPAAPAPVNVDEPVEKIPPVVRQLPTQSSPRVLPNQPLELPKNSPPSAIPNTIFDPQRPRLGIIKTQEAYDEANKVLRQIESKKGVGGIITAIPAARGSNVTLFGLNGMGTYVPVNVRGASTMSNSSAPDKGFIDLFTNVPPNPSVDTPVADNGGFGSPVVNQQPVDFAIGPFMLPVARWGMPNPQVVFPMQSATGVAFMLNFNEYEMASAIAGGVFKSRYKLGDPGSEVVVNFTDPDGDGIFTPHYYAVDKTKPDLIGIAFNSEKEAIDYMVQKGYIRPSKTIFGNPTYVINSNGDWRFKGLEYYGKVTEMPAPVKGKDGSIEKFILKDGAGLLGTTGPKGTATIKNNPDKTFYIYYDPKAGRYELKAVDVTPPYLSTPVKK